MENNLIIEQIKKNYELCLNIHNEFENAKINLLNELFSKVTKTLDDEEIKKTWEIEFHEITEITRFTKFFSAKLQEYNGKNHNGNYIYYCIELQNKYNDISFGLVRSNEVKNRLDNDCFKDIVQENDYCKSWNKTEWWACCYKKFSNVDNLILDYLRNEEKFINEIRNDLEKLEGVLEKLNKKLIEQ